VGVNYIFWLAITLPENSNLFIPPIFFDVTGISPEIFYLLWMWVQDIPIVSVLDLFGGVGGLLFSLQYLDDNLLFFDEESTDDSGSDSSATEGSTVGTGNGLLAFGVLSQLTWTTGFDTTENVSSVTAYWGFGLKIFFRTVICTTPHSNNCSPTQIWYWNPITDRVFIRFIFRGLKWTRNLPLPCLIERCFYAKRTFFNGLIRKKILMQ